MKRDINKRILSILCHTRSRLLRVVPASHKHPPLIDIILKSEKLVLMATVNSNYHSQSNKRDVSKFTKMERSQGRGGGHESKYRVHFSQEYSGYYVLKNKERGPSPRGPSPGSVGVTDPRTQPNLTFREPTLSSR